jgi:ubiquitin-like-conjugating enzyme ATG3
VSAEHARKTVTIEEHPHGSSGVRVASIHPCRHAEVMLKLGRAISGDAQEFQVDQ